MTNLPCDSAIIGKETNNNGLEWITRKLQPGTVIDLLTIDTSRQGCTKFFLAGNQPYLNLNWLRDFVHICICKIAKKISLVSFSLRIMIKFC